MQTSNTCYVPKMEDSRVNNAKFLHTSLILTYVFRQYLNLMLNSFDLVPWLYMA